MAATTPVCDFGWKAVDFELKGTDGNRQRILDAAGKNGLVVAFICNHCPYVKAVADRMAQTARDLAALGIGFVAVNSNDSRDYPEDSFEKMVEFARKHDFPFPYLHDEEQEAARRWDAVCTPDFFGFNENMELQYRGRLDAARPGMDASGVRRDLYEAMVEVAQTGKGPPEQVPSMGCSIKWSS